MYSTRPPVLCRGQGEDPPVPDVYLVVRPGTPDAVVDLSWLPGDEAAQLSDRLTPP